MLTLLTYDDAQPQTYLTAVQRDPSAAQPQRRICRRLKSGTVDDTRAG
jgi:hypothetical protein